MESPPSSNEPQSSTGRWWVHSRLLGVLTILLLTALAYSPIVQCGFIWDDDDYVTNNQTLRSTDGLIRIWTDPGATPQYYPFVHTSFWMEYQLWGLSPLGYHLVNVAIHMANACLLWRILVFLRVPGAWLIGALFAVHPVHVESVAWVTERKNVLSGLFYLIAMWAYIRFADLDRERVEIASEDSTKNAKPYGLLCLLLGCAYVAALLSKTVVATFPAAALVVLWWKTGGISKKQALAISPLFVLGLGFGMLTVWLEKYQVGAEGAEWDFTIWERTLIAGRVICFYATKLVLPYPLVFTYERWEIDAASIPQALFPLGVTLLLLLMFVFQKRMGRGPLAASLLFCGTLFPALGYFDVFPMRFSFVADHFQYLASIAFLILLINLIIAGFRFFHAAAWWNATMAVVALSACGFLTWKQVPIYEGLETLWRDTLAKNPSSWMAHSNLGSLLIRRGDLEEAESHLSEAIRLKPNYHEALANLGKVFESRGWLEQAKAKYVAAIEARPSFAPGYNGLGVVFAQQGEPAKAVEAWTRAVRLQPIFPDAYSNLAALHLQSGDLASAIRYADQAVEQYSGHKQARYILATAHYQRRDYVNAERQLRELIGASNVEPRVWMLQGAVAAGQQKYSDAIQAFERVVELQPKNAAAWTNLSSLHSELGDTEKARRCAEKAAALQ